MEFILEAKVYLSTGEDWTDVKLLLNTSNPTDRVQKPNLTPWYLNFQQEADFDYNMRGSRADQKSAAPMNYKLEEVKVKMDIMQWSNAQIIENQLNNEYEIENKYTLKSGNVETQIEINRINANAFYEYASAPKLNSDAFLMGPALIPEKKFSYDIVVKKQKKRLLKLPLKSNYRLAKKKILR